MIQDVSVRQLVTHNDQRGFFREVMRSGHLRFCRFGQLSHSLVNEGVVKAWHGHQAQMQWTYVAVGKLHVVLHDLRCDSKTFLSTIEMDIDDSCGTVYSLPPGVVHGYRCLRGPAHVIYVTSGVYDPSEEIRLPMDDLEIGGLKYDWETMRMLA